MCEKNKVCDKNKMCINITAEDYFNELKLMEQQYGQEEDLYPWIYMLLQMAKTNNEISIRDVHRCRRNRSQLFFGLAGSPDFAILNKKDEFNGVQKEDLLNSLDKLYGCVEIKTTDESLLDVTDLIDELIEKKRKLNKNNIHRYQIVGHLLWYGKVLYTNGLEWQLIEWNNRIEKLEQLKNALAEYLEKNKKIYWPEINAIQTILSDCRALKQLDVSPVFNIKEKKESQEYIMWDKLRDWLIKVI